MGEQIRKFVTMGESRKCLSKERDIGQGGMEGELCTSQAALILLWTLKDAEFGLPGPLKQLEPSAAIPATLV